MWNISRLYTGEENIDSLTVDALSGVIKGTAGLFSGTANPSSDNLALISSTAGVLSWNNQALLTTSSPAFTALSLNSNALVYTAATKTLTMNTGQLAITGTNAANDATDATNVVTIIGGSGFDGAAVALTNGGGFVLTGGRGSNNGGGAGGFGGDFLITGGAGGNASGGLSGKGGDISIIGGAAGTGGTSSVGGVVYLCGGQENTGFNGSVRLGWANSVTTRGDVYIQSLSGLLLGTTGALSAFTTAGQTGLLKNTVGTWSWDATAYQPKQATVTPMDSGGAVSVLNQIITVNSGSTQTLTLPSVGAGDVGVWLTVVKLGAGKVIIDPADADTIADSTASTGTIFDDVATETYATITLRLVTATLWVIVGAHGTWVTT